MTISFKLINSINELRIADKKGILKVFLVDNCKVIIIQKIVSHLYLSIYNIIAIVKGWGVGPDLDTSQQLKG